MNGVMPTEQLPNDLPDQDAFELYMGSLGVSNMHHIIIYDRSMYGFELTPRMWWMLRV